MQCILSETDSLLSCINYIYSLVLLARLTDLIPQSNFGTGRDSLSTVIHYTVEVWATLLDWMQTQNRHSAHMHTAHTLPKERHSLNSDMCTHRTYRKTWCLRDPLSTGGKYFIKSLLTLQAVQTTLQDMQHSQTV